MFYTEEKLKNLWFYSDDIKYISSHNIIDGSENIRKIISKILDYLGLPHSEKYDEFVLSLEHVILKEVFILNKAVNGDDFLDKYLELRIVNTDEFIKDINCIYEYSKDNKTERLKYNFFRIIGNENKYSNLGYTFNDIIDDLYILNSSYSLEMSILRKYICNDYENNKIDKFYKFGRYNKTDNNLLLALHEENDILFEDNEIIESNLKFKLYVVYK